MALIDKGATINAINQRAEETGGIGKTYYERAAAIVATMPNVVEEKKTAEWKTGRPRKKGQYLCYISSDETMDVCNYIGKGEWKDYDGVSITPEYVAYWMELPDAP